MRVARLEPAESLLLDAVRVSAAAMVAVGHITQPYFSVGLPNLTFLARGAVAVFFVLSGFVIRYVTLNRPTTFGHFIRDRASRVYSVVIPALLLTWLADSISLHVNPTYYADVVHGSHSPFTLLMNLVFAAQLWTLDVGPLSNSPFWSLNYEVGYYLIYGCAFYLAGYTRWVCVAVTMLILGPKILILLPVWLIGCHGHDLYQKWNASGRTAFMLNGLLLGSVALFAAAALAIWLDRALLDDLVWMRNYLFIASRRLKLGMTGGAVGFLMFGVFGMIALLRALFYVRRFRISNDNAVVRSIRFIAEGTFPIYLFHFPLYMLIAACVPYNHASLLQKLVILFAVLTVGVLAGHSCNMLKEKLRGISFARTSGKRVSDAG